MSTTTPLTPPPVAGPPTTPGSPGSPGAPGAPGRPPRRTTARVIAILAIVVGGILILGTVTAGIFSAVRAATLRTETFTADATGIAALDIDISGASLTVEYGRDAALTVDGAAGDWRFERDGDVLRVTNERSWWTGWRWGGTDEAVLTLPSALQRTAIDAEFGVSGGVLHADGTYEDLDIELAAGSIELSGTARDLDVDASAGRTVFDLDDVDTADITLSAGAVTGTLTGSAPTEVTADVSAGRLQLTLPDTAYAIASDVSAGEFRHTLTEDPASPHRVSVQVSAGAAILDRG